MKKRRLREFGLGSPESKKTGQLAGFFFVGETLKQRLVRCDGDAP